MRLTVRRIIEAVALTLYPDRNELITQALDFAARNLDDQILPLKAA